LQQAADAWDSFEFFEDEMIDAGDTVVRVAGSVVAAGAAGSRSRPGGRWCGDFRNGVPNSATLFQTNEEALAEADLGG
jgi:hypothetical protein